MPKQTKQEDIPAPEIEDVQVAGNVEYKLISLDLIDDPEQPIRTDLTPASVEDLVMSIKQVGLIEPIVVKATKNRYEVIAGHRRTFAARLAKLVEVPCHVHKANSEQTEMMKIHENLYRAEVRPSDEAKHFSYLIEKHKMTPVKIAQLITKSLSYVHDRLDILNYPDFLLDAMNRGKISFSVAREFARFDDLKQMQSAVYYALRSGMTQEMAKKWVGDYKRSKEQPVITEQTIINADNNQQEIIHTANCVYCNQGVSLMEAEVVYMHNHCLKTAQATVVEPNTPLAE
jgi:ParB family chromosome partitioning protein